MSDLHTAFDDLPASDILLVTVRPAEKSFEDGLESIDALQRGNGVDEPDTIAFTSADDLFETLTPRTVRLLETIANASPESIRETARLVDRDVKNVHREITALERLGIIQLERVGRRKRPIFPYEELLISFPLDRPETPEEKEVTP